MKIIGFFLTILLFTQFLPETIAQNNKTLIVGIKETPPFIIKNPNGKYSGVSVDLWEEIAAKLNIDYKYKEYDLTGLLDALVSKEIDVCINPLTVTSERVKKFDFTQPFYITNLAIASSGESRSPVILFLENLFSMEFLEIIILLFLVILGFGIIEWIFERRVNPEEFETGVKGIWSGIWWSAVTMTTVGYGDKSPKTTGGRIVALVWMFTAIIIISGFTGGIASSLTVNRLTAKIQTLDDLKKVTVGTVEGSSSEAFLIDAGYKHKKYPAVIDGLEAVYNDKLEAFVYDEPIMKYLIKKENLEDRIVILPNKFNKQYYSFSLPLKSIFLEDINPVLLEEIKDVKWKAILSEYNLLE